MEEWLTAGDGSTGGAPVYRRDATRSSASFAVHHPVAVLSAGTAPLLNGVSV